MTLRNLSNFDLWPYLVSMDPSNYTASIIYPTTEDDEQYPPLPVGGTLEIAANWPDPTGLNQTERSGFLKIYLASTSVALNMFARSTAPPLELAPPARSSIFMDAASVASSCHTIVHVWDSILLHLSFIRS